MTTLLANAFALGMLDGPTTLEVIPITVEAARDHAADMTPADSIIGHASTARVVSDLLGKEFPVNRRTLGPDDWDELLVAQYHGPRLPEGATELPEGADIRFWLVAKRR